MNVKRFARHSLLWIPGTGQRTFALSHQSTGTTVRKGGLAWPGRQPRWVLSIGALRV